MIGRRLTSWLAAGLVMAASALPSRQVDRILAIDLHNQQPTPSSSRLRFSGKPRRSGSKLARKAARGRVGISTIR